MWCKELIETGYIDEVVTHPDVPTFELFTGYSRPYEKKKNVIMNKVIYTPDRIIKWNIKAMYIFFNPWNMENKKWDDCYFQAALNWDATTDPKLGFYYSIIEVKGPTGNQKAYGSDFKFTQKWLWQLTQQYVQKVMLAPAKLFKQEKSLLPYLWAQTFTPKRYYFTEKLSTSKNKLIPLRTQPNKKGIPLYTMRTLEEFLDIKKAL